MRPFIDADGRLFGRLNLLDALAAVFLAVTCGLIASAAGLFDRAQSQVQLPAPVSVVVEPLVGPPQTSLPAPSLPGNFVPATLEVDALLYDLTIDEAQQLAVGDQHLDEVGRLARELAAIYRIEPRRHMIDVELGSRVAVIEPKERQAHVRIRFHGHRAEDIFFIEGEQRLRAGSRLPFITSKYQATFRLATMDTLATHQLPPMTAEFRAVLVGLTPKTAAQVAVGDVHRNAMGEVVAEILSVGPTEPERFELNLEHGTLRGVDPEQRQISVTLRIHGYRAENFFYSQEDIRVLAKTDVRYHFVTDQYQARYYLVPMRDSVDATR